MKRTFIFSVLFIASIFSSWSQSDSPAGAGNVILYNWSAAPTNLTGNLGATGSGLPACSGTDNDDVWYRFTSTTQGVRITGTTTAISCISWIFTKDWPLDIGGKPHFALPAWIPIMFELTVLFAAVGMVLTFCYLCQLAPFVKKHHFHARATDDLFAMVIECTDKTNTADLEAFLASAGAVETKTEVAEEGWWIGRYDRDEMPFENKGALA